MFVDGVDGSILQAKVTYPYLNNLSVLGADRKYMHVLKATITVTVCGQLPLSLIIIMCSFFVPLLHRSTRFITWKKNLYKIIKVLKKKKTMRQATRSHTNTERENERENQ